MNIPDTFSYDAPVTPKKTFDTAESVLDVGAAGEGGEIEPSVVLVITSMESKI